MKTPGLDHPIKIAANPNRVVVRVGAAVLADSRASLTLSEASYPPVHYLPRQDVDMGQLEATPHTSTCPYKGEASYFSIPALGQRGDNAVWSYVDPYPAVAQIAGHLAFYPDRVEIREDPAGS